jgi:hypothetical protein
LSSLQLLGTAGADRIVPLVHAYPLPREVFTELFPGSGRLFMLTKNLLPTNGRRSIFGFAALPRKDVVSDSFSSNGRFSDSTILALSKYCTIRYSTLS